MTEEAVSVFEKLLFADTFRGKHSTGVYARRKYKHNTHEETVLPYFKCALDGPEYLKTLGWDMLKTGGDPRYPRNFANFYVGHNRYATMGAINSENAHPFRHGNITLVHNGTLVDQTALPDWQSFEVDSENVCHSINKIGAGETIKKLDGAFTLIWHDASDDTLHLIRNEERPFHLAVTKCGKWFGASEELMLKWIIDRSKGYTIERSFELEVGTEYVFDVNDTFELKETIEREIIEASSMYGWGRWNGSGWGSYATYTPPATKSNVVDKEKQERKFRTVDQLFSEEGIPIRGNDIFEFTAFEWEGYGKSKDSGQVTGYFTVPDPTHWVEVQCHGVNAGDYKENQLMNAKVVGGFKKDGIVTIVATFSKTGPDEVKTEQEGPKDLIGYCEVCGNAGKKITHTVQDVVSTYDACEECSEQWSGINKEINKPSTGTQLAKGVLGFDDDIPFSEPAGTLEVNVGGVWYTKEQWDEHYNRHCGLCGMPIPFEEADDAEWELNSPICYDCVEAQDLMRDVSKPDTDEHFRDSIDSVFQCAECGVVKSDDDEAVPHICRDCYADKGQ